MDPNEFSLGNTAALVLGEGVKFLYEQATELLRRRRDRKDHPAEGRSDAPPPVTVPENLLQGQLSLSNVDDGALERYEVQLAELRRALSDYADDIRPIVHSDVQLLTAAEAIRGLLEIIYGRRITFAGEQREISGSLLAADDERRTDRLVVQVLAQGAGAVAIGGDNTGSISTNLRKAKLREGGS